MKKPNPIFTQFFDNELSEQEAKAFLNALATNQQLATKFELYKMAHENTMDVFHQDMEKRKQQIKSDLMSFRTPTKEIAEKPTAKIVPIKSRQLRFYQILSAASILLLLFFVSYFTFSNATVDVPKALALADLQIEQVNLDGLASEARGTTTTTIELEQEKALKEAFRMADFSTVLKYSDEAVVTADPNILQLLQGIAFYKIKELEKAKTLFQHIIEDNKGQIDIAQWALVSVYLKQGDTAAARKILTQIKPPTSKKAKEVLKLIP